MSRPLTCSLVRVARPMRCPWHVVPNLSLIFYISFGHSDGVSFPVMTRIKVEVKCQNISRCGWKTYMEVLDKVWKTLETVNGQANIGYYGFSELMNVLTRAEILVRMKDNEPEGNREAVKLEKEGWKLLHKPAHHRGVVSSEAGCVRAFCSGQLSLNPFLVAFQIPAFPATIWECLPNPYSRGKTVSICRHFAWVLDPMWASVGSFIQCYS